MSPLIERGAEGELSGVADSDEQRAAHLAAVVEERAGCVNRLAAAEEGGNAEKVATLKGRIAACDLVLEGAASAGASKAKRATRRKGS